MLRAAVRVFFINIKVRILIDVLGADSLQVAESAKRDWITQVTTISTVGPVSSDAGNFLNWNHGRENMNMKRRRPPTCRVDGDPVCAGKVGVAFESEPIGIVG